MQLRAGEAILGGRILSSWNFTLLGHYFERVIYVSLSPEPFSLPQLSTTLPLSRLACRADELLSSLNGGEVGGKRSGKRAFEFSAATSSFVRRFFKYLFYLSAIEGKDVP